MRTEPTAIPDVKHLFPSIFTDHRGAFLESYNAQEFAQVGIRDTFIQDNLSVSKKGVLRGLHFQTGEHAQAKLVSVVFGTVFDVAVDIRKESPTFGNWVGVTLSDSEHNMLYIPQGFAHGFYVLSEEARFSYKCSGGYYNKEASSGIIWNDPTLNIAWPLDGEPVLSAQDSTLQAFSNL